MIERMERSVGLAARRPPSLVLASGGLPPRPAIRFFMPDEIRESILNAFAGSIAAYRNWLRSEEPASAGRWETRLGSADPAQYEGAIGEAVTFDYLAAHVDDIRSNDLPGQGGPDFFCTQAGHSFLVETTNIAAPTVEKKTGLSVQARGEARHYSLLTRAVNQEVRSKAGQFSQLQTTFPIVVFVTVLQFDASAVCVDKRSILHLLTGTHKIGFTFNTATSEVEGEPFNKTELDDALFVAQSPLALPNSVDPHQRFRYFRRHISAVVVAGFGVAPPSPPILGVLHPNPLVPFQPTALASIPFARLDPWPPSGRILRVAWSDELPTASIDAPAPRKVILPGAATVEDVLDSLRPNRRSDHS